MSDPPAWMESLVDLVDQCMEPHSLMGPLGYSYAEDEALTEINVYPCPIELVGVGHEGELVSPLFSFDLQPLWCAFEAVETARWQPHPFGPGDDEPAYIAIEGRYEGHQVWLRVLAQAPEDEESALQVDPSKLVTQDGAQKH